jgi:hypothetical protein
VNLGATLRRKRAVSQKNTEAAQGTTEKKPRVELIGRISRYPVENPFSLWSSVNLGATLCRKRTVSQRNTEAAQGTTEKKPRVELIGRTSVLTPGFLPIWD